MVLYGKNPLLMANPIRLKEMLCISDGNVMHQWWQLSMAKNRVLAQFKSGQNMSSNFALKFLQEGVILEQVRILWQTKKKTSGIQNRCQNWFWSSQFWEIQAGNRCSYLCWIEEVQKHLQYAVFSSSHSADEDQMFKEEMARDIVEELFQKAMEHVLGPK